MPRHAVVLAFALLATMSVLTYATVSYPVAEPGPFALGLGVVVLAGVVSTGLGWHLLRRTADLKAELERKTRLEAHSRQMCSELERKLEERTTEMLRQRDIVVRTEKLTSLSRLVGGVAHELNNPLMAILGEATILRERCTAPELRRGLRVIEQQATRCANLIRDLTAFASEQQRQVQPLDVHALLEGALSQAAMVAPNREVKISRQYGPSPLIVTGNMEQLQQALANVIGNAYQALAAQGEGELVLRSYQREDGCVRLEVTDTGGGIEPEVLPYIFDPFYTRPRGRSGPSVGMGLSVALGLIQANGGRIWAESELGKGTSVFIELPAGEVESVPEREVSLRTGR